MRIDCQCGHSHQVTTALAGREIACPCGRSVPVPSLRKLEQMRPDVLLYDQLDDADYWEKRGCFVCSSPANVDAVAECILTPPLVSTLPVQVHPLSFVLPLFGLLGAIWKPSERVVIKHSQRVDLPLRYCAACSTHSDLTDQFVAQLQQTSLGRDFLAEFPEIRCHVRVNPHHP